MLTDKIEPTNILNFDGVDAPIENVFVTDTKIETTNVITHTDFFNNNISLKKFKIIELKEIARGHNLPVSGNKNTLIERITQLFVDTQTSIIIQKMFRGHMVRLFDKLKGPAHKDRSICTNDSDFCTLEPLDEIPNELFFSYTDKKDFKYGFNILSLMQVYKQKGKINNPYNREIVDAETMSNIHKFAKLLYIIYPESCDDSIQRPIKPQIYKRRQTSRRTNPRNIQTAEIMNAIINDLNQQVQRDERQDRLLVRLQTVRAKSSDDRIIELFGEIDSLGNYTQASWFSSLEKRDLARFFRCIHDIWMFRAQLSWETKRNICSLLGNNPFQNVYLSSNYSDITFETLRTSCLTVMENMVYSGVDVEYQRLGALFVLSALTMVSPIARNSSTLMQSLFEATAY
jgi:hypothetical protein